MRSYEILKIYKQLETAKAILMDQFDLIRDMDEFNSIDGVGNRLNRKHIIECIEQIQTKLLGAK